MTDIAFSSSEIHPYFNLYKPLDDMYIDMHDETTDFTSVMKWQCYMLVMCRLLARHHFCDYIISRRT